MESPAGRAILTRLELEREPAPPQVNTYR